MGGDGERPLRPRDIRVPGFPSIPVADVALEELLALVA